MSTVVDEVGVVPRAVCSAQLQEGLDLGGQRLQRHPAAGVVATEGLDQVVGEKSLHAA